METTGAANPVMFLICDALFLSNNRWCMVNNKQVDDLFAFIKLGKNTLRGTKKPTSFFQGDVNVKYIMT